MRIGLLTHSVNPRGGVVHTLELARALHDAGHEVTVYAPAQAGQTMFRRTCHRVQTVTVGPTPQRVHDMVEQRMRALEHHLAGREDLPHHDIWHAQDGIGANALANLVEAGRIRGFVRTVHHLDHFEDPRVMAWQRRSIERADKVLCVSAVWQDVLREQHGVRAERVGNGVDLQRFQRAPGPGDARLAASLALRPGAPLWLSVGGVEERKNTLRALQAFALHRRHHPQAQFVIAGGASLLDHDDYQREFARALGDSGLAGCVTLTGALADEHMPALFRLADGVLMPSLAEGFGLVVLEALASGTPVVVSQQPPFTEYLGRHDAHWADPTSPPSIAAAMDRALAQPPFDLPEPCRRHSWGASAQRHLQLYAPLCAPA